MPGVNKGAKVYLDSMVLLKSMDPPSTGDEGHNIKCCKSMFEAIVAGHLTLYTSPLIILELLPTKNPRKELSVLESFLETHSEEDLELNQEIARVARDLRDWSAKRDLQRFRAENKRRRKKGEPELSEEEWSKDQHSGTIRPPDSIHAATAMVAGCDFFVTLDKKVRSLDGTGMVGKMSIIPPTPLDGQLELF